MKRKKKAKVVSIKRKLSQVNPQKKNRFSSDVDTQTAIVLLNELIVEQLLDLSDLCHLREHDHPLYSDEQADSSS